MSTESFHYPATAAAAPTLIHYIRWLFLLITGLYALGLLVYVTLRFMLGDTLWWLAFLHIFGPYYFLPLPLLIALCWLIGARGWAVRLLPLLLLGGLLFGWRFIPRPAVTADAPTLKLVTFNVLPENPNLDGITTWLEQTGADIVLLQELGRIHSESLFEALSAVFPYTSTVTGTGSALLSKYPLTASELVDLGGWQVNRHVLDVDGEPLVVYNIHMPMPTNEQPHLVVPIQNGFVQLILLYDETYRNMQIRGLLEMVRQETLPYIVAGDFNTSDNALIYEEIAVVMRDSYRETNVGWGGTWPADVGEEGVPAFVPALLRIDYVWHSADLQAISSQIGPNLRSDHLPLVVTLTQPER